MGVTKPSFKSNYKDWKRLWTRNRSELMKSHKTLAINVSPFITSYSASTLFSRARRNSHNSLIFNPTRSLWVMGLSSANEKTHFSSEVRFLSGAGKHLSKFTIDEMSRSNRKWGRSSVKFLSQHGHPPPGSVLSRRRIPPALAFSHHSVPTPDLRE